GHAVGDGAACAGQGAAEPARRGSRRPAGPGDGVDADALDGGAGARVPRAGGGRVGGSRSGAGRGPRLLESCEGGAGRLMPERWLVLNVRGPAEEQELLAEGLFSLGCSAVEEVAGGFSTWLPAPRDAEAFVER